MSASELSVVCKSCGNEVSPYVTECPYCGTRLRKRAPKLERRGDEIHARERRARKARRRLLPRPRLFASDRDYAARPWTSVVAIVGPAILLLVQRAADLSLAQVGAILGPVGSEWWRYLTAPWAYTDLGYLFVVAFALAIFGPALEERIGQIPTAILLVACGGLGMLAADGLASAGIGDEVLAAAGGNGVALGALGAWLSIRLREARATGDDDYDLIGAGVVAAVLLALPLVESLASLPAGVAGALVGLLAGLAVGPRAASA